jgi:hypothetical protein
MVGGRQVPLLVRGPENATFAGGGQLLFHALGNRSADSIVNNHFLGRRPASIDALFVDEGPAYSESAPELVAIPRRANVEKDEVFQT